MLHFQGDLGYIVVPEDDIIGLTDDEVTGRNENNSETPANTSELTDQVIKNIF